MIDYIIDFFKKIFEYKVYESPDTHSSYFDNCVTCRNGDYKVSLSEKKTIDDRIKKYVTKNTE